MKWESTKRTFEHEGLKPANIRTNQRKVQNLVPLKQCMNVGLKI